MSRSSPSAIDHVERPAAADDIEERGSGSVGDFGGELAGQPEADIVLREQQLADAFEVVRFVVAHPEQFGKSEAGEDRVGDRFEDLFASHGPVDEIDLGLAALVAPDEGGADHGVGAVEDDQAMHLAGEADAADVRGRARRTLREHAAYG